MNATAMILGFAMLTGCGGGAFSAGDEKVARDDAGDAGDAGDEGTVEAAAPDAQAGQPEGEAGDAAGPDQDCDGGYGICCPSPSVPACVLGPSGNLAGAAPGCCMPEDFSNHRCLQVNPPSACR